MLFLTAKCSIQLCSNLWCDDGQDELTDNSYKDEYQVLIVINTHILQTDKLYDISLVFLSSSSP